MKRSFALLRMTFGLFLLVISVSYAAGLLAFRPIKPEASKAAVTQEDSGNSRDTDDSDFC